MNNTYADLVDQTFNFPQEDFKVEDEYLQYNGQDIKALIDKYGTPLKLTYLTKSSHFSFIVEEALKNEIHLETSYAYDIDIINKLYARRKINKETFIICNGYKQKPYTARINRLLNTGFKNVIPIL